MLAPQRRLARPRGWGTQSVGPGFSPGERGVEADSCSLLDEHASFIEGAPHLLCHGAGGLWDEPGDQTRCTAGSAGAGGTRGGAFNAVVNDGCDVVGIAERPGLDQAREQSIDVVVVSFCSPKLSRQRPVGV